MRVSVESDVRKVLFFSILLLFFGAVSAALTPPNHTFNPDNLPDGVILLNGIPVSENRVIVKQKSLSQQFKAMTNNDVITTPSGIKLEAKKHLNYTGYYVYEFSNINIHKQLTPENNDDAKKRDQLKTVLYELNHASNIEFAEPDYVVKTHQLPDDPMMGQLWGLHNTNQDADIDALEAWDISTGSDDVVVGVIDTGIDYYHPDLVDNIWINPGEIANNGIDDDANGYVDDIYGIDAYNNDTDPFDGHFHGTHVAGTIGAAANNSIGVAGVSWHVKLMALKFLSDEGWGYTSAAIEILDYVLMMKKEHGIQILLTSNSWGGGGFSQALKDAIVAHSNAGILFVAAAGNSGTDNDQYTNYPSNYNVANVIAVAATDNVDDLAIFSNYGVQMVDLGAPGVAILSTTPDASYASYSGTSMATPHVSGALALLKAHKPELTATELKEIILNTVDIIPSLSGKVMSQGRLNIHQAIRCNDETLKPYLSLNENFSVWVNVDYKISARLHGCKNVKQASFTLNFESGETAVTLVDDGSGSDDVANDGIYNGNWTPKQAIASLTLILQIQVNDTVLTHRVSGSVIKKPFYQFSNQIPFHWTDISFTGTSLNLYDDQTKGVELPFSFEFYKEPYSKIYISDNGGVLFNDDFLYYFNEPIPSNVNYAQKFIVPFWDDLRSEFDNTINNVFYNIVGEAPHRQLIIQYNNLSHHYYGGDVTFQVILNENQNLIMYRYKDLEFGNIIANYGASATVGIQYDATYAQQFHYELPTLSNQKAILLYHDDGDVIKVFDDYYQTTTNQVINIELTGQHLNHEFLNYSVIQPPLNGSLTGDNGTYQYQPNSNFNGLDAFTFKASDGQTESVEGKITLAIKNTNTAPTIGGEPQKVIEIGQTYHFLPDVADAENNPLSFYIFNQPLWLAFNSETGEISGMPASEDIGEYKNIIITVSDGQYQVNLVAFNILVTKINSPPSLTGTPKTEITEGDEYTFQPVAIDPDVNDVLLFQIVNKPDWATFSSSTGLLTGIPKRDGIAKNIVISVTDGKAMTSLLPFNIAVKHLNNAPSANNQAILTDEDQKIDIMLVGSDEETQILTYKIIQFPNHGKLSGEPPLVSYLPTNNFHGKDQFQFEVFDGAIRSAPATVTIDVMPVNDSPQLVKTTIKSIVTQVGKIVTLNLSAHDNDTGDHLTYFVLSSHLGEFSVENTVLIFQANSAGTERIDIIVEDDQGLTDKLTIPVTVHENTTVDENDDGVSDHISDSLGLDKALQDNDNDNIPDWMEIGDPNNPTDSDNDGIIDVLEYGDDANNNQSANFMVSQKLATDIGLEKMAKTTVRIQTETGQQVINHGQKINQLPILSEKQLASNNIDPAFDFPVGLFDFSVKTTTAKAIVTLSYSNNITFPSNAVFRKQTINGDWVTFTEAVIDTANNKITLTLTDNDIFDFNQQVGIIRDPGGIAVKVSAQTNETPAPTNNTPIPTPTTPTITHDSGGGGAIDFYLLFLLLLSLNSKNYLRRLR